MRPCRSTTLGVVLGLACLAGPTAASAQQPPDTDTIPRILVIVNPDASVDSAALSTGELRRIYLLRRRFWRDGRPIAPVNLEAGNSVRLLFSRLVLDRTPRQLGSYWNDLYFHGVEPPPVLGSEEAVQLWVARTPGAVGYLRAVALDTARAPVRVVRTLP